MNKLLRNKNFIQATTIFIMFIIMILVGKALIQVAKNNPNDMKCYWTTRGLFCVSELEGGKNE